MCSLTHTGYQVGCDLVSMATAAVEGPGKVGANVVACSREALVIIW